MSVSALATLKVPGAPEDLETRLTELSLKMTVRSEECEALSKKSRMDRFLRSEEYSRKILDIRNGVADDICKFTFHRTISIEILVKDMAQKVGSIDGKVDQVLAGNRIINRKVEQVDGQVDKVLASSSSIDGKVEQVDGKVDQVLAGNRVINRKVEQVDEQVDQVHSDNILDKLKCSAARYNADNTPRKCMDGTRIDVIKGILGKLIAPPDPSQRLVILSG
ncbi:hypothetical protein B0H11DRAFT_2201940, partial [Mycena galericulata]